MECCGTLGNVSRQGSKSVCWISPSWDTRYHVSGYYETLDNNGSRDKTTHPWGSWGDWTMTYWYNAQSREGWQSKPNVISPQLCRSNHRRGALIQFITLLHQCFSFHYLYLLCSEQPLRNWCYVPWVLRISPHMSQSGSVLQPSTLYFILCLL